MILLNDVMIDINNNKTLSNQILINKINNYSVFIKNKCKEIENYSNIFWLNNSNHNMIIQYNYQNNNNLLKNNNFNTNYKNIPNDYHIHIEYNKVKEDLVKEIIPYFINNLNLFNELIKLIE